MLKSLRMINIANVNQFNRQRLPQDIPRISYIVSAKVAQVDASIETLRPTIFNRVVRPAPLMAHDLELLRLYCVLCISENDSPILYIYAACTDGCVRKKKLMEFP